MDPKPMAKLLTAALLLLLGSTVGSGIIRSRYGQHTPLERKRPPIHSGSPSIPAEQN